MTKPVTVNGIDYLLVEVPENTHGNYFIHEGGNGVYLKFNEALDFRGSREIKLPPGSWELIGMCSEIGEDAWKGIVQKWDKESDRNWFVDYQWYDGRDFYTTATESARSLVKSYNHVWERTLILKKK